MAEDDVLRKNRGLGMLLASMGNNIKDTVIPKASGNMQDNQPSGKAAGGSRMSKQKNSDQGAQKQKPEWKNKRKYQDESTFGSENVSSWASMKEYDDDHDGQWFEDENARLAELYGGNFIYAKYLDSQPGKVGYYCELCFAEMNARKSLDLHCSGMKHLKKKAMWEKMDGNDEDSSDRPMRGHTQPPHKVPRQGQRPHPPPRHPPSHSWYNRDPPPMDFRGPRHPMERSPYRQPPPPEFRDMRDQYSRYSRDRYDSYERREAPPPPVISGQDRPRAERMPPYSPELCSPSVLFEGISDGSCSELLKRLAVCRVKNLEDSALATNVTSFLIMSLKDYYSRMGPPSVVHVLEEITVKMNIMKDLLQVNRLH